MTDKDATTEAELRAIFGHLDPVPQLLDDAARAAFGWRTVDAEIAELLRDSADALEEEAGLLVRSGGGPRQLSFESPQLGIELEVTETGPRERRLAGQLLPPGDATVTVERPGEDAVSVQADDLGRFVLDGLRAGAVRLHIALRGAQIAIPWTIDLRSPLASLRPARALPARRDEDGEREVAAAARRGELASRCGLRLGGACEMPLRDIVRAIIAAAIGVANDVPSQAAQPSNAIAGSPSTLVFSRANVDWRSCRARRRRPTSRSCCTAHGSRRRPSARPRRRRAPA